MTTEEVKSKINGLPEVIQDHLFDEEIADLNEEIMRRNGLPDDVLKTLTGLIREAVVKNIPLASLVGVVKERLKIDEEKAKKVALDIAGFRLLPLNGYLGDVDGLIRALGGNPDDFPSTRIQVEERTTDAAIKDVEVSIALGEMPHRLKSRFEDALRSFFKGVRTESQLLDILTREEKVGGVGLERSVAEKIITEAQEERKSVLIDDEPRPREEDSSASSADGRAEEGSPVAEDGVPEKKPATFVTVLPEDEEEIDQIKKTLPEEELAKSADTDAKIKASVDEIFRAAGVGAGSSETLQARFKTIIENRLRDIRDELETLEVLVQPKELGGMSMSEENARRVLTLIEGKLKGVHEMHREAVKEKKSEWVAKEAEKAVARVESEKSAEAAARDAAYLQATSRSKKIPPPSVPAPTPPADLPIPSGNASAPVPHALPTPPRNPVPAPAPTHAMAGGETGTPQVKNQPPASPVRPTMPSHAPKPTMKPVMSDVTASAPMATGPVEELRTTSVEDFRRLSKDPKEATLKIKDKIDLLGEESFTKRSQGIAAWNSSGVFRLYLEMMGEALEGKPMTEVIASRQAENKPCLTKEEIDAIVRLGTALRA